MKLNLDNQKIDASVLMLIAEGIANTNKAIMSSARLEDRTVDNSLKRLKVAGKVVFNKEAKRWDVTQEGKLAALQLMGQAFLSPPSAHVSEADVQSADTQSHGGDAGQKDESSSNMETKSESKDTTSAIDEAINKAKANKTGTGTSDKGKGGSKPRLSAEEKEARDKAQTEARAKAKTEREALRVQKKADKASSKSPAHMSKVDKAAAKLPSLSEAAELVFNEATAGLDAASIAALAAHLTHFNRVKATERALGQGVNVGDEVKIVSSQDTRYIGKVGVVTKAQRIRCYVQIEGFKKDAYFYTSDVQVTKVAPKAAATA